MKDTSKNQNEDRIRTDSINHGHENASQIVGFLTSFCELLLLDADVKVQLG